MGMQLNTGDTGRTVLASADGSLYSKIFGDGCFVLAGGNELKAEIQSNNLIKIYDGDLIMQGRHVYIPASDSDTVTINNGSQGMNRKDLIVARYTKTSDGTEDVVLAVIQGTATEGTAVAPEYVEGDILTGAAAKDFPLYEVTLSGINITSVTKKFSVLRSDLSDVSALGNYTPMLPLRGYSGNMNNMPTGTFLCELAKCTNAPSYPMGMWAHVICYAGFSQTAIFYNGTSYPPVIATRTYANNAWTAWAEQAQGFDFASVRFNGTIGNALQVDLTNPYADVNKPRYVDRAKSATNMPSDCQWGVREVCQITSNWVMVRITGWTTGSQQAIWTNVYVNSNWTGWSRFSRSSPHVLWSGTGVFDAPTLTLNKNVNFFEYYEIVYEVENGNGVVKSTGRIPIGNGATLDGINSKGLLMRRTTGAPSGTSLKLNSGGYFASVNSSSSPYSGACCPRKIIGYI